MTAKTAAKAGGTRASGASPRGQNSIGAIGEFTAILGRPAALLAVLRHQLRAQPHITGAVTAINVIPNPRCGVLRIASVVLLR